MCFFFSKLLSIFFFIWCCCPILHKVDIKYNHDLFFFNSFLCLLQRMFKACFTMLQTQNAFIIHIEKKVFSTLDLSRENLIFEGFNIVIIEMFKFQKTSIYMDDGSNTKHITWKVWFEKYIKYKFAKKEKNSNNNINWGWPYMVYLIWLIHLKFYNIGKRSKIQIFKFYFLPIFVFWARIANWPTLAYLCPINLGLAFMLMWLRVQNAPSHC